MVVLEIRSLDELSSERTINSLSYIVVSSVIMNRSNDCKFT